MEFYVPGIWSDFSLKRILISSCAKQQSQFIWIVN